jgi:hypothetical protein
MIDKDIPELLILPPNIDLHSDPLYLKGEIILQVLNYLLRDTRLF